MGPDAMISVFWMLSFKPTFSLSSFTFIKKLFSSSSLSAIRVLSSAYLRLLIFLPAILNSNYYAFLLTLTSRNQDRRGNKGKRIKPHFCWAGSFPCPLPTTPLSPPPQHSLSIKSNTKGASWSNGGWDRRAGEGTWHIHKWRGITSWTRCPGVISKHRNEATSDTESGPRHRSKDESL